MNGTGQYSEKITLDYSSSEPKEHILLKNNFYFEIDLSKVTKTEFPYTPHPISLIIIPLHYYSTLVTPINQYWYVIINQTHPLLIFPQFLLNFPFCSVCHPWYHITLRCHVSLGSSILLQFLRLCLFWWPWQLRWSNTL